MKKVIAVAIAAAYAIAGGNVLDSLGSGVTQPPLPAMQQVSMQQKEESPSVVVDEKGNVNLKKSMNNLIDKKLEQIYQLLGELQKSAGGGKKKKKKVKHYKKPATIAGFLQIKNHESGEKFRNAYAYNNNGDGIYLSKKNDKGIRSISFNEEYVLYKDKKKVRLMHFEEKKDMSAYAQKNSNDVERLEIPPQPAPVTGAASQIMQMQSAGEKKIEDLVNKSGF